MFRTPISRPPERAVVRIPVADIRPNPSQPRAHFAPGAVEELASSIRRHGQLSPILVRTRTDGGYELVAGERRLRAIKLLKNSFAEAIVLDVGDCECALIALVENIQREQLHFLDEAEACRRILTVFPITQEKLAASLSCSPSALANRLRLLKLPAGVVEIVRKRGLTERHARALLRLRDVQAQEELAIQAAEGKMSVKQLEMQIDRAVHQTQKAVSRRASPIIRDNRIVINALMDTVRELERIGVRVTSRIEEKPDHVEIVVCIPACGEIAAEDK